MRVIRQLFFLAISMILLNCSGNSDDSSKDSPEISVQKLKAEVDAGSQFFLLDVRTTPEFNQGRLSFADGLIPYDSLPFYLEKLPVNKDTALYVFCRSGRRSGIATSYLQSIGYTNVYNVTGGIIAWQIVSD